jgi:putative spermidine/putrescine transport system substrate-binding protein
MFQRRLGGAIAVAAMVAAACGQGTASTAPTTGAASAAPPSQGAEATLPPATAVPVDVIDSIGEPEGELNLVIWAGYAEKGAVDPAYDWVTPFQEETGCTVNTTDMTDSNNGVSLIQSGQYDGISASGDATTRLITGGLVEAIDPSILSNYANVFPGLKDLPHNTVNGVNYGVPHGRGANLLMYNTEAITPAPTTWDGIWEGASANKGKISVYDSSIFIADAALHLMATQPDLGITDPYQLTQAQFDAAVALLTKQRDEGDPLYWTVYTEQVASFAAGDVTIGTTWPLQVALAQGEGQKVEGILPTEGSTGWSDTWMLAKGAAHPNCMLLWMNHMMSAEANAEATVWFGEAATSPQACAAAEALSPGHCDAQHATDEDYFSKVHYWATPQEDCADADAATTCKSQDDWVDAWSTLRGS